MGSWFFLITTRVLVVALLPLPRASFSAHYTASVGRVMPLDSRFSICVVCGGESQSLSLCALCTVTTVSDLCGNIPSVNVFSIESDPLSTAANFEKLLGFLGRRSRPSNVVSTGDAMTEDEGGSPALGRRATSPTWPNRVQEVIPLLLLHGRHCSRS